MTKFPSAGIGVEDTLNSALEKINILEQSEIDAEREIGATEREIGATEDYIKEGQDLNDAWLKSRNSYETLFNTIEIEGVPRDPIELVIGYIRAGESLEDIYNKLIAPYEIPITVPQLRGLYTIYGGQ